MQTNARRTALFVFSLLVAGTMAFAATPDIPKPMPAAPAPAVVDECGIPMSVDTGTSDDLLVGPESLDATAMGGSTKCCDPALEPGVNGNPLCFEGHTCCANGQWQCNNADGTPSCSGGQVCGSTCGGPGASCNSGADCCSGQCKGNHRCR